MSSDDRGPLVLTPDMLQSHMRLVDVADLNDWAGPYEGNVGAAHTHLGAFGQLQVPVVVDGEVLFGQEYVAAERFDAQYGGQLNVLDLTDLDWPREKVVAAVLGLHNLERQASVDAAQLLDLLQEVQKADEAWLQGAGYDGDDLEAIYEQLQRDQEALDAEAGHGLADGVDADDVPDSAPAITQPGDVWIIGPHRVACGDCRTMLDDLPKGGLLLTDPPYGVSERTDRHSKGRDNLTAANDFVPVHGDQGPFDPSHLDTFRRRVLFGGNYYAERLPPSPTWLVWDKLDGLESVRDVGFDDNADVELAWSNLGGPARLFRHRWKGMLKGSEQSERRVHPTQKPVALMAQIIRWATDPSDVVVDPYGGSGSTLVAAHQEGRTAALVEIDPSYVDVICKRAQLATGITPVLESTGEAHDFTGGD